MPALAEKKTSYEDLYSIPENMIGEIIDGELLATPRPSRKHANVASNLSAEIIYPYRLGRGGPGGWIILVEPEVALGDNILVPDLAGWKIERFPAEGESNWIPVSPDWICEIVSPSSIRIDRIKKMAIYNAHGVPHFWLIDPFAKTLEAYRLEAGRWVVLGVHAENDKVRIEPFGEAEIDLGELWLENALKHG